MKTPGLLFGRIAVKRGFCSQEEVDKALNALISRSAKGEKKKSLDKVR